MIKYYATNAQLAMGIVDLIGNRSSKDARGPRNRNLTGRHFGQLDVLAIYSAKPRRRWLCRCECGKETICRQDGLLSGDHVSCGCQKVEQLYIHGGTGSIEHKTWSSMIERCYTPTHFNFMSYGGRGIYVCTRWRFGENDLSGFECFLLDMGKRPSGLSLERKDNNGPYVDWNCEWASRKQQARNRRNTKLSTDAVEKITGDAGFTAQTALARIHGVSQSMISRVISGECWS